MRTLTSSCLLSFLSILLPPVSASLILPPPLLSFDVLRSYLLLVFSKGNCSISVAYLAPIFMFSAQCSLVVLSDFPPISMKSLN